MVDVGFDLRRDSRNLDCVTGWLPKHGAHLGDAKCLNTFRETFRRVTFRETFRR